MTHTISQDQLKNKKNELLICQGVEGKCVYLNDTRIDGAKPWGGGKTLATFHVSAQDLIDNVPELKSILSAIEKQPTPAQQAEAELIEGMHRR